MKVALVGPVYPYRGGIAHYTTMLYRSLVARQHEVLLVSFRRQYPSWLFPGQSDKDPSREPLVVSDAHFWIDSLNPLTWLQSGRRIVRYCPDLVILQWWTTFWAPAWIVLGAMMRFYGRCSVWFVCHNVLPHEAKRWDKWIARFVLRWGDKFIVQSADQDALLASLMPNSDRQILALPLFDMFVEDRISMPQARQALDLPLDMPVLLFFGIIRRYKGLDHALRALPLVLSRWGKVLLVVAGEIWHDKDFYLEMIQRLKLEEYVVLEDRYIPNEQVAQYFSAADVMVAPYDSVTGSGVLQMSRSFGLPVITTVADNEVYDESKQWMVVPPGEENALADTIVRFLEKGASSRETAQARTSTWQDLVCMFEKDVS